MTLQASKKLNVKGRINFYKTCYCIMEEFLGWPTKVSTLLIVEVDIW